MSLDNINVLFVAGFGPIVQDDAASRELYAELLNISFEEDNGYLHTTELPGARYFALWPLSQAAESCFGHASWPSDIPTPQGWIEFDVEDIEAATATLEAEGYHLLVTAREEPWGQTVTRLIGPNGLLIGITHTPWMRETE
ncbi:VOC family protein [Halocatena marina]|uniref:VOC family protein n=1 Tax=Halocatena marina TaxID=2934937 RepID=A0ABD5YXE3_9EURY|nr:VOC family protein [Halocatena marina]